VSPIPDEFASEFVLLIRWFDREHPGCTIMLLADDQIPLSADQLRSTCAQLAPGRPAMIRAASTAIPSSRRSAPPSEAQATALESKDLSCLPSIALGWPPRLLTTRGFKNSPKPGCGWSALSTSGVPSALLHVANLQLRRP